VQGVRVQSVVQGADKQVSSIYPVTRDVVCSGETTENGGGKGAGSWQKTSGVDNVAHLTEARTGYEILTLHNRMIQFEAR